MDSSGRIHMYDSQPSPPDAPPEHPRLVDRVVSQWPMPERCDARKVLAALEKLDGVPGEVKASDAVLLPLSPFDQGYVLGLREYLAWRKDHP